MAVHRTLFEFDTLPLKVSCRVEWPTYKEINKTFDVNYLMFLTSKDDILVAAKTNTRTPRSRGECLWMTPSISPLITCKTLHCCAPSVTSTQNKRQPTSNPQNPGFNNRGLRRGFARVIKLPKPCPGVLKNRRLTFFIFPRTRNISCVLGNRYPRSRKIKGRRKSKKIRFLRTTNFQETYGSGTQ